MTYKSLLLAITDTSGPNNNNKMLLEMYVVAILGGILGFFPIKTEYFIFKVHLPNLIHVWWQGKTALFI